MTGPAEVRALAAELLRDAGLTAHDHLVARLIAPAAVVTPGTPWLASGDDVPFGHVEVRLLVTVVVGPGSPDRQLRDLEALATTALLALQDDFEVSEVSPPFGLSVSGTTLLAADLTASTTIQLTEE